MQQTSLELLVLQPSVKTVPSGSTQDNIEDVSVLWHHKMFSELCPLPKRAESIWDMFDNGSLKKNLVPVEKLDLGIKYWEERLTIYR